MLNLDLIIEDEHGIYCILSMQACLRSLLLMCKVHTAYKLVIIMLLYNFQIIVNQVIVQCNGLVMEITNYLP